MTTGCLLRPTDVGRVAARLGVDPAAVESGGPAAATRVLFGTPPDDAPPPAQA